VTLNPAEPALSVTVPVIVWLVEKVDEDNALSVTTGAIVSGGWTWPGGVGVVGRCPIISPYMTAGVTRVSSNSARNRAATGE
jgi:hypothetical protein